MKAQFQRILDLVKRTGDRMVVTDPDGDHAYIVMDLEQYELFLAKNQASLVDFEPETEDPDDFEDVLEPQALPKVVDDQQIPDDIRQAVEHDLAIIQSWEQEQEKKKPEQSLKKDEGGTDEERFYLEPIE